MLKSLIKLLLIASLAFSCQKIIQQFEVRETDGHFFVRYKNNWMLCNDTPNIITDIDYVRAVTACTNAGWYGNK